MISGLFGSMVLGVMIQQAGSAEPKAGSSANVGSSAFTDVQAKAFVERYEKNVRPVEVEVARLR